MERKKEAYGLGKLRQQTAELSKLNDGVRKRCVIGEVKNTKNAGGAAASSWKLTNPFSKSLQIDESDEECKFLGIIERYFVRHLRNKQMERWKDWRDGHAP